MISVHPLELALYAVAFAILGAVAFYAALVIRENARRERERLTAQFAADTVSPPATDYLDAHIEHFEKRRKLRVVLGGRAAS